MPHSGQRVNARLKLAECLADIRNTRAEQSGISQDCGPTPAKRRSAINYVDLGVSTAKQIKLGLVKSNSNVSQASTPDLRPTATRRRTYNLKLFERTVDLAPFLTEQTKTGTKGVSLYAVCRAWVDGEDASTNQNDFDHQLPPQLTPSDQYQSRNHAQTIKSPDKQVSRKLDRIDSGNSSSASSTPDATDDKAPDAEVHRLPTPIPNKEIMQKLGIDLESECIDIRIPKSVRQFKPASDLERTFDRTFNTMARHECLMLNRERWSAVRKCWAETNKIYEMRYEDSLRILHDMFKVQQGEA